MKREELKAKGLTDEQIEFVMGENGKDINAAKADLTDVQAKLNQATTQVTTMQQQLADRDKDIQTLKDAAKDNEGVSQKLTDLQAKYDADTKALEKKLEDQRIETAIDKAFADVPFASNLAKRAAIADFKAKGYKLADDGTFTEAASFIEALKKDDPAAFKTENHEDGNDGNNGGTGGQPVGNGNTWVGGQQNGTQPRFTQQMTGQQAGTAPAGQNGNAPIGLALNYVRKPPENK